MKIIILGAGITGRLAKLMMPGAYVFDAKSPEDKITAEYGVAQSITPLPLLESECYTRKITIDNKIPTLDLIMKYKQKIAREGNTNYGDLRQFEPKQIIFIHKIPKVKVFYNKSAHVIKVEQKRIYFNLDNAAFIEYDKLISTIPLINLVKISNMFNHFKNEAHTFFMHRPIYLVIENYQTKAKTTWENYITDLNDPFYRENFLNNIHSKESLFKIKEAVKLYPGKIYNNDFSAKLVSDFATYGIYCVGRYAEWNNAIHLWNVYEKLKWIKENIE